ncbi:MAG TPA: acyltransferase [Devosia sp.]|nr:acyltransferase [Devosia sp.]
MPSAPPKVETMPLRDPHPAGKSTIFGLQALRFWAAAMVVVTHALNREVNAYHPFPLPRAPWMESGVDIFFVISGFIMVYILRPESRAGDFWLQRFTRIVPLYWLATLVAFLGGLVLPDWFFGTPDPLATLQSLLFVPMGPQSWPHPLISPGWTLNYEFAFYTILALCLAIRRPPFATAAVVIITITAIGPLLAGRLFFLGYYSDQAQMLEFLFGMGAAVLWREHRFQPWQGLAMAVLGMVLIYFLWEFKLEWPRGIKAGLPAFLVVFGALVSEPIWRRSAALQQVARLGDASYSIYIVHYFFVTAIATLFARNQAIHDAVGPVGFTVLMVVVGIGAGILAHIYVERPLLRLVRSWLPGHRRTERPPQGSLAVAQPRG